MRLTTHVPLAFVIVQLQLKAASWLFNHNDCSLHLKKWVGAGLIIKTIAYRNCMCMENFHEICVREKSCQLSRTNLESYINA